jgi:hypothetical protein
MATDSGPSTITGRIDFSAAAGQFANNNVANGISGGVHFNVAAVASALNTVNALNTTLGGETGTHISINGNTTINASAGTLDGNGNRVFTVDSFSLGNGQTLTINGDAAGDSVVFNFSSNLQYHGNTSLSGLTPDQGLFNVVGGSNLSGGPTLDINNNGSGNPQNVAQGVFLDPNGAVSVVNANVVGRVFGGDSHDFQYVSGANITAPSGPAPVPAPPGFALALSGVVPLGLLGWLHRRPRAR